MLDAQILFFPSVTASENRHEEQLCTEGSLGTGYWVKLIYVIHTSWHDIEMDLHLLIKAFSRRPNQL